MSVEDRELPPQEGERLLANASGGLTYKISKAYGEIKHVLLGRTLECEAFTVIWDYDGSEQNLSIVQMLHDEYVE